MTHMVHYYVKREQAGDGSLWQAYSDADNRPVCLPTTEAEAMRVARQLNLAEGQRAWDAASPFERNFMSNTSGT
jgi:hypothetical protein